MSLFPIDRVFFLIAISIYYIVDYNPLMGDSGGGMCFRPPRRGGGGG